MFEYKQYMLKDCNRSINKEKKLICIEENVPLKVGKVNYVSYKGKKEMIKNCEGIKGIKGCDGVCRAFFDFYPEPIRRTCKYVKEEWEEECGLRVLLIEQTEAGEMDEAEIT